MKNPVEEKDKKKASGRSLPMVMVSKGGSWIDGEEYVRLVLRDYTTATRRNRFHGFRIARTKKE